MSKFKPEHIVELNESSERAALAEVKKHLCLLHEKVITHQSANVSLMPSNQSMEDFHQLKEKQTKEWTNQEDKHESKRSDEQHLNDMTVNLQAYEEKLIHLEEDNVCLSKLGILQHTGLLIYSRSLQLTIVAEKCFLILDKIRPSRIQESFLELLKQNLTQAERLTSSLWMELREKKEQLDQSKIDNLDSRQVKKDFQTVEECLKTCAKRIEQLLNTKLAEITSIIEKKKQDYIQRKAQLKPLSARKYPPLMHQTFLETFHKALQSIDKSEEELHLLENEQYELIENAKDISVANWQKTLNFLQDKCAAQEELLQKTATEITEWEMTYHRNPSFFEISIESSGELKAILRNKEKPILVLSNEQILQQNDGNLLSIAIESMVMQKKTHHQAYSEARDEIYEKVKIYLSLANLQLQQKEIQDELSLERHLLAKNEAQLQTLCDERAKKTQYLEFRQKANQQAKGRTETVDLIISILQVEILDLRSQLRTTRSLQIRQQIQAAQNSIQKFMQDRAHFCQQEGNFLSAYLEELNTDKAHDQRHRADTRKVQQRKQENLQKISILQKQKRLLQESAIKESVTFKEATEQMIELATSLRKVNFDPEVQPFIDTSTEQDKGGVVCFDGKSRKFRARNVFTEESRERQYRARKILEEECMEEQQRSDNGFFVEENEEKQEIAPQTETNCSHPKIGSSFSEEETQPFFIQDQTE